MSDGCLRGHGLLEEPIRNHLPQVYDEDYLSGQMVVANDP